MAVAAIASQTEENHERDETRLELTAYDFGAESRNRTGTPLRARDFESRASTNSAIPACIANAELSANLTTPAMDPNVWIEGAASASGLVAADWTELESEGALSEQLFARRRERRNLLVSDDVLSERSGQGLYLYGSYLAPVTSEFLFAS